MLLWLIIQGNDNKWAIAFSYFLMFVMLFTAFWIMQYANRAKLNIFEKILLRGGFSLYAGWMISATTLASIFFFNTCGFTQPKIGYDQGQALARILWIAQPIFMIASFYEHNPLFGLVYLWTIIGMHSKHADESKPVFYSEGVLSNTTAILIYYCLFLAASTAWFAYSKVKGKCTRGLFY